MLSMTGYGKGSYEEGGLELTCEIKTVNNRYLDVSIKAPRIFAAYEDVIRNTIRKKLTRGHADVFISFKDKRTGDELITDRAAVPVVHAEGETFEIGKGKVLREGKDVAIIANGLMVYEAVQAAETLAAEGIDAMVINMCTIKPLDEELVIEAAKKCGKVITCEEHSIIGGLGEAVASCLSEKLPTPVKRIGVNDEFGHSGPAAALLKQFGLSAEHIVEVAKDLCK